VLTYEGAYGSGVCTGGYVRILLLPDPFTFQHLTQRYTNPGGY